MNECLEGKLKLALFSTSCLKFYLPTIPNWIYILLLPFIPGLHAFPILLFSSISLHCSLKKAFLSLLPIFWNSAVSWLYLSLSPLPFTSLLFSAIYKTSSENHFVFLYFLFLGMFLVTAYCMVQTPIHTSLGTLQTRSSPLNLFTTFPA